MDEMRQSIVEGRFEAFRKEVHATWEEKPQANSVRPAKPGTGIIAGGPMRAVFETIGLHDVVAKSVGSSNPHNMIKATFVALTEMQNPRVVAAKRGKKVADIVGRREGADATRE